MAVLVVSHRSRVPLLAGLETLVSLPDPPARIVVVDNASDDGTVEALQEAGWPTVEILPQDRNLGFPVANNLALAHVRERYVALLNPDTHVSAGALSTLLDTLETQPTVGIVGPRLLGASGKPQDSAWRDLTLADVLADLFFVTPLLRRLRVLDPLATPRETSGPVDTLSGAALVLRTETLREAGGFDPRLFWIEDRDLCLRLRQTGLEVWQVPAAVIHHVGGHSARRNLKVSLSNQLFNKIRWFRRHGRPWQVALVTGATACHATVKWALLAVLGQFRPELRPKRAAYGHVISHVFRVPEAFDGQV